MPTQATVPGDDQFVFIHRDVHREQAAIRAGVRGDRGAVERGRPAREIESGQFQRCRHSGRHLGAQRQRAGPLI